MVKKIAFIGAGNIAQAINKILERKNIVTEFWDKDISKIINQKNIDEVVKDADVVFLCVPSFATRDAISSIKNFLSNNSVVVSVSKGIEELSSKTVDVIIEESFSEKQKWGLLYGPMLADEIMNEKISAAVYASKEKISGEIISGLFSETKLKLSTNLDVKGVALCGVLKNIYSILFGMFDGLSMGNNANGWLFTNILEEFKNVIFFLGGEKNTVESFAGVGDLIATGFSSRSKNHSFGFEIIKKGSSNIFCEGFISLPSLIKLMGENFSDYKFLSAINKIILDKKNPHEILNLFFDF